MVEDFVAEVTYLEYLQKERCMNDNHVFKTTIYKKKKKYNFIVHTVGYPPKIYLVTPLLNLAEQNKAYNMIAYHYK